VASPNVAGVDLASGAVRVVVGRREDRHLRVSGVGYAAVVPNAVTGGYVADRRAVVSAITSAFVAAERTGRAERVVVAIDGDDVRTYHEATTFERDEGDEAISSGEAMRAIREAREAAAHGARDAATDDPALRGIATAELRDDVGGFVLDGRAFSSIVGHRGRYLEVRTDIALAPLVHAGAATAALDAARRRATATSGTYALARLVAESGIADAGIVRVMPDLTAVAVIRDGRVGATRAFGLGRDALLARGEVARDAPVWARCVISAVMAVGVELPGRWYASGLPDELAALPRALNGVLTAERGGGAEVTPLRPSLLPRVIADAALAAEDLVAAGAAALGAEVYS